MTVEDVRDRVDRIRACAGDDESAHNLEDLLHIDVLRHIADGRGPDARLAREALKTVDIEFARWCA